MILRIHSNERGSMVVVDLYLGEIGNAVLSLREDAMAARTIYLVEDLSLVTFFSEELLIDLRDVIWNIIRRLILICASQQERSQAG